MECQYEAFFTVNHKIWLLKHRQIEGTPMGSNCAHIVSSPGEILWSSSSKILVPCKTLMTWQTKGKFLEKIHCINYWPSLLKLISPPPPPPPKKKHGHQGRELVFPIHL